MPTKGRERKGADAELRRFEPVSEEVVLAAADRAVRHWQGKSPGATLREIAEHLGSSTAGGPRVSFAPSSTPS
jgi:hypothetical protein